MNDNYIGSYELTNQLGEGTFGIVFEGFHRILGRRTALKVLKHIGNENEINRRLDLFIREARILAHVRHPNIIDIYDVFFSEKGPCIAMEFIEGENLRTCMNLFTLSNSESIEQFSQIVEGLEVLHDNNIIHRDLKPENILIKFENNEVKITDFGISIGTQNDLFKTRTIGMAGTLPYMSPEQLEDQIDYRSDLWSLGVMLYEMITKQLPFTGSNEIKLMDMIREGKYKRLDRMKYPKWILEIVEGLLEVNPINRIQCCEDILSLLPIKRTRRKFTTARDLNPEDLLNYILKVLPEKGCEIDREEAIRCAAKDSGIERVGKNIRHEFLKAIRRGVNRSLIFEDNEKNISRL